MPSVRPLVIRMARRHIRAFADESEGIIDHHLEAMECRDCDDFLQVGIDTYEWLIRVDHSIRASICADTGEYSQEPEENLRNWFRIWLKTAETATPWIDQQEQRGYVVENLIRFRECRREVEAIVESFGTHPAVLPGAMIQLRDEALEDYQNGETVEFV